MAQALERVVGRLQVLVGDEHDRDLESGLQLGNVGPLLIEQEAGDLDRHLNVQGSCALFHGLFLQDAQNVQGAGIGIANDTGAVATRA